MDIVSTGEAADHALALCLYDLAILDIGLPGLNGLEVLKRLRAQGHAAGADAHRARHARRPGARARPRRRRLPGQAFDLPELEARVRAQLRRSTQSTPYLEHGELRFDTVGRRVYHGKQPLDLSPRELALLELLLMRAGRVVSKAQMVNLRPRDRRLGLRPARAARTCTSRSRCSTWRAWPTRAPCGWGAARRRSLRPHANGPVTASSSAFGSPTQQVRELLGASGDLQVIG